MKLNRMLSVFALVATLITASVSFAASNGPHMSSKFEGPKANMGTVTHTTENGKSILRVSADFKVPDTPAPTWRVVDYCWPIGSGASSIATPPTRAGQRCESFSLSH